MAVNAISVTAIKKANPVATKCIKSWLGFSRSTTVAVIHHPAVLDIPFLSSFSAKAKISYLSEVTVSKDPLINEIASLSVLDIPFLSSFSAKAKISYLSAFRVSKDPLINEIASLSSAPSFRAAACIPESAVDALQLAISSVSEISRKTLPRAVRCLFDHLSRDRWDEKLTGLSVQCKFKSMCELEDDNRVWHRIMQGLPAGQLSFIVRGASDTLPTPLNLARWKLRVDSRCPLCSSPSPTQGSFTWRHDSVLRFFLLFFKSHLSGEGKLLGD